MRVSLAVAMLASVSFAAMGQEATYPIKIEGALGANEVAAPVERVLALSPTDADHLLSIGVVPVAIPSMPQTDAMTNGTGILPWQGPLYPAGIEKVQTPVTDLNYETIAALSPDLLVATTYWGLNADTYPILSAIAPVLHFDTGANADPWQTYTRKIGAATGHSAEAEAAIAKAEAAIAAQRASYPSLEGKTFNAIISPGEQGFWVLCSEEDNLARVTKDLGLKLAEFAKTVECDGGKGEVSWEQLGNFDADLIWLIPDNAEQASVIEAQALWSRIPAVARGAVVTVPKTTGVPYALAFPSPLSLEWVVGQLAPQFAEAVAK